MHHIGCDAGRARQRRLRRSGKGGATGARAAVRFGLCLGVAALAVAAIRPETGRAAEPSAVGAPAQAAAPAIEEWLNQTIRLRETAQARERPAADGKPAGAIHSGAEIKAIGLVAGKNWVEIELPDHSLAYLPRSAIEFENPGAPRAAASPAEGGKPAGMLPGARAAAVPSGTPVAAPAGVRGLVTKVPNAATLVVGDQRLRLAGVDPGPPAALGPFEKWVEAQGALDCEQQAQTGRYRCLTGGAIDVGQAAILNGAGRVGDGASPAYRESETEARNAKRGFWGQP